MAGGEQRAFSENDTRGENRLFESARVAFSAAGKKSAERKSFERFREP